MDLCGQWIRYCGGRAIDVVTVPGGLRPAGEYTLERGLRWPWKRNDGRSFLRTEGVLAATDFTLDDQPLGTAGPWCRYEFEILAPPERGADCRLKAAIRDTLEMFGPVGGRRFDGGLVRPLYFERRPAVFISDVVFRYELTPNLDAAECEVRVEVDGGEGEIKATLATCDSVPHVVASARGPSSTSLRFTVAFPALWSPAMPHLYTLRVMLYGAGEEDIFEEKVGFRRLEIRGRDFYLNNERLVLKGVCRHEFMEGYGYSPPTEAVRREMALIRQTGFNYVRLVHSPHGPDAARLAAELGLLVSEEPATCWDDLSRPEIAAGAAETLRRTIKRDRNCPSVLAWHIYNECSPNTDYAVALATVCRELDPGRFLSFADCSLDFNKVRAMTATAGLSYYGINLYSSRPADYRACMEALQDRPLLFTEWGGTELGDLRTLRYLCRQLAEDTRANAAPRAAGFTFWCWADYEEYSRPEPDAVNGWTIQGLTDREGRLREDLLVLLEMNHAIDYPPSPPAASIEVLARRPARAETWRPVPLPPPPVAPTAEETALAEIREGYPLSRLRIGSILVSGILFECRGDSQTDRPLLLGPHTAEIAIPVGESVRRVAVLGQVALYGGYPGTDRWPTVIGRPVEPIPAFGASASTYVFEFENGEETVELRHGLEILRGNAIAGFWLTDPCSPRTSPALRAVVNPSYEVLRLDLWEHDFGRTRSLRRIRWVRRDTSAIQALFAVSIAPE